MIAGYYYLHANGALIYRRATPGTIADFENSDLVKCWWPVEPADRRGAWRILIEAAARGATPDTIAQHAHLWHCDNPDAYRYAVREGIELREQDGEWIAAMNGAAGHGAHALAAFVGLFHARALIGRR
jgi:hypothetical protein